MINKSTLREIGLATFGAAVVFGFVTFAHLKHEERYNQKLNNVYKNNKIITIQSGDYIDKFAKQYTNDCNCGLDYRDVREKIKEENQLKDSNIYIGKELKIPFYKGELK